MALPTPDPGLRLDDAYSLVQAITQANQMGVRQANTAAGTNQATALSISNNHPIEEFTTAAASTGAMLPLSSPGKIQFIANNGANPMTIYTNLAETAASPKINTTAGATGVTLTNGKNAVFFCATPGQWYMILSA